MEYLYATLILHKAEKEITTNAVIRVLEAAGFEVNPQRIRALADAIVVLDLDKVLSASNVMSLPIPKDAVPPEKPVEVPVEDDIEGEIIEDDSLEDLFGG